MFLFDQRINLKYIDLGLFEGSDYWHYKILSKNISVDCGINK